ncbi:MAG: Rrf2 family transcriptional regulator [Alphaproteobacteria bacterium]|nr:Rrf2 family transcriptional regulator [Alphaproteobacteria bacterium]
MKLTQFTDYAYRSLIYLAINPGQLVQIQDIADSYNLSKHHLTKVIQKLSYLGYVETVRGKGGGIRMAMPAEDINIGKVLRGMEGPVCVVECLGDSSQCVIEPGCVLKPVLARATEAFIHVLDDYTLADLTKRPAELGSLLFPENA